MTGAHAEQVTDAVSRHGEGPVWDERSGSVRWVDMVNGTVHRFDPRDGSETRARVAPFVAAIRPRRRRGWVVATGDAFLLTNEQFLEERRIRVVEDPALRFNDGTCVRDGAFLCGTAGAAGSGRLYRLDRTCVVSTVLDGVSISNGIGPDPAGEGVFYVDTPTRRVDRLVFREGGRVERRPFADLREYDGMPDGIAVDSAGGVWVAMWGAGTVLYIDPEGRVAGRIELPTPHVSACAFGGPDFAHLYITTSTMGLGNPDERAGALFRAEPGVPGLPPETFGG